MRTKSFFSSPVTLVNSALYVWVFSPKRSCPNTAYNPNTPSRHTARKTTRRTATLRRFSFMTGYLSLAEQTQASENRRVAGIFRSPACAWAQLAGITDGQGDGAASSGSGTGGSGVGCICAGAGTTKGSEPGVRPGSRGAIGGGAGGRPGHSGVPSGA